MQPASHEAIRIIDHSLQIPACLGNARIPATNRIINGPQYQEVRTPTPRCLSLTVGEKSLPKKMARVSSFVLLVVLLFLVENERSSGLPTKIKSNGE